MKLLTQDDDGYRELTWSKTPPKEPGWYWRKRGKRKPEIVHVCQYSDELIVFSIPDIILPIKDLSDNYWLGPIPVPSTPKEEE